MLDPGMVTPFSSTAVAVIVIGSPTAYRPLLFGVNVSRGGSWLVVTGTPRVSDAPWLSVTVTVAGQSFLEAYLWSTTGTGGRVPVTEVPMELDGVARIGVVGGAGVEVEAGVEVGAGQRRRGGRHDRRAIAAAPKAELHDPVALDVGQEQVVVRALVERGHRHARGRAPGRQVAPERVARAGAGQEPRRGRLLERPEPRPLEVTEEVRARVRPVVGPDGEGAAHGRMPGRGVTVAVQPVVRPPVQRALQVGRRVGVLLVARRLRRRVAGVVVAEVERALPARPAEVLATGGDVDLLPRVPADVADVQRDRHPVDPGTGLDREAEGVAEPVGEHLAAPRRRSRRSRTGCRRQAVAVGVDVEDLPARRVDVLGAEGRRVGEVVRRCLTGAGEDRVVGRHEHRADGVGVVAVARVHGREGREAVEDDAAGRQRGRGGRRVRRQLAHPAVDLGAAFGTRRAGVVVEEVHASSRRRRCRAGPDPGART